jgi:hypothetical protein
VKNFFKKDFEKSLKKEIIIYAFYGSPIDTEQPKQQPSCDLHKIAIHLIKTELTLLSKYREYENVFSKKGYKIIQNIAGVTHAIDLKERTKSPYKPIYALLKRELRILRDYFTEKETIG